MKVTHIVVHYSATYDDQDTTIKQVDEWHRARNFKMVGYHFFYRLNGMEEFGRPITMVGAHVGGQNQGKIGLCFAGGLKRETGNNVGVNTMTLAQEKALITRIKWLKEKFPNAAVCGHKDLAATQCPGFHVRPWWEAVVASGYQPVFNKVAKKENKDIFVLIFEAILKLFKRG